MIRMGLSFLWTLSKLRKNKDKPPEWNKNVCANIDIVIKVMKMHILDCTDKDLSKMRNALGIRKCYYYRTKGFKASCIILPFGFEKKKS